MAAFMPMQVISAARLVYSSSFLDFTLLSVLTRSEASTSSAPFMEDKIFPYFCGVRTKPSLSIPTLLARGATFFRDPRVVATWSPRE